MLFRKLTGPPEFDLGDYVINYIAELGDQPVKIYLGCDSQNHAQNTVYATTVVFHIADSGCHIIYKKDQVPVILDMWTRLWGEAERSVEAALYLREKGIEIDTIDLDYNDNPNRKSNKLVSAAVGYVESLGFKARIKPELLPAAYAADDIVN